MLYTEQDMQELAAMEMRNVKGAIHTGAAIPKRELMIAMSILSGTYSRNLDHATPIDWE